MKRFVTYLYLYDGRMKGNNAGFIKVEINGEKSAFLVQIKNLGKYSGKGKVYLVYEAEAIPVGTHVVIKEVRGVKLIVEMIPETENRN